MRQFLAGIFLFFSLAVNADNTKSIHVQASQKLIEITLPANPTTGFQWKLEHFDSSVLKLLSQRFDAPKTRLIGAGGVSIFTFKILNDQSRPKSTKLMFRYAQPWEPSSASLTTVAVIFD